MKAISPTQPSPVRLETTSDVHAHTAAPVPASTPQAGGAFTGLPVRQRRNAVVEDALCKQSVRNHPVPDEILPLTGYLMSRRLNGKLVDRTHIDRLQLADQAVCSARTRLPHGSGNVDANDDEGMVRAAAAQLLHIELMEMGFQRGRDPMASMYATGAMAAKVFGAGVCDNAAAIAALAYGEKAQSAGRPPEENVRLVSHETQLHTWAEVHAPDKTAPAIVMDPWAKGTAVFLEDSWLVNEQPDTKVNATLDISSAAEAQEWTDEFAQGYQSSAWQRLDDAEEVLSGKPRRAVRTQQPMLDEDFTGRARDRLNVEDPWASVRTELKAVELAMTLGGRGVPNLVAGAQEILERTRALVGADPGTSSALPGPPEDGDGGLKTP